MADILKLPVEATSEQAHTLQEDLRSAIEDVLKQHKAWITHWSDAHETENDSMTSGVIHVEFLMEPREVQGGSGPGGPTV